MYLGKFLTYDEADEHDLKDVLSRPNWETYIGRYRIITSHTDPDTIGKFQVRVKGPQHKSYIARSEIFKHESNSIKRYNDILVAIGQGDSRAFMKTGNGFFDDLNGTGNDEGDFFADCVEDDGAGFFADLEDEGDFFSDIPTALPKVKRAKKAVTEEFEFDF